MESKVLTRADCDEVIKKCTNSDQFEVVTFKLKPFEDKEREYYKPDCVLEVSAKVAMKISRFRFFVKKFILQQPPLNELMRSIRASQREILFYQEFLPLLTTSLSEYDTDFVAEFYYGEINRLMILEDMSLKFFGLTRKANPHMLDRFHICLVLKAIARLHAGSLAYEEKHKDSEVSRLFDETDLIAQEPLWRLNECLARQTVLAGTKGVQALIQKFVPNESFNEHLNKVIEQTFKTMQYQTKFRNVLGHGDLHPKNVLFNYENHSHIPEKCVLLNFGYCRYFMPAYDVLTFIFSSTTRLFRQHYFTYFIKFYHECLHQELMKQDLHIDDCLTFEEFQRSINFLMPAIKLKALIHLEDWGAKPGFYKQLQKDERAFAAYLYQDKGPFVKQLYKKDPLFQYLVVEGVQEVVETVTVPQVSRENCYEILENLLQTTVYDLISYSLKPVEADQFELHLDVAVEEEDQKKNKLIKFLISCSKNYSLEVLKKI